MTDRAELAKRLRDAANSFACGDWIALNLEADRVSIHEMLREAAAALSAGEGGAWSLPKFFREEEPSFGFEADTESMSPEQAAITLMRRLRREVNELRNPQPRKNGEAWILSQPEIDDLRDDAYKTSAEAKRLIAQRMDAPAGATEAQSLGKCFECDGELSVWCSYCNGNATADWLAAIPIVPTDALRKAYQFYLDTQSLRESSANVPAGASEEWLRSLIDEEHRKLTAGMNLIDAAHGEFNIKAAVNALRRLSPSADLLKAAKAIDQVRLVIESAVRRGDSGHNHALVVAALARIRQAIRNAGGEG